MRYLELWFAFLSVISVLKPSNRGRPTTYQEKSKGVRLVVVLPQEKATIKNVSSNTILLYGVFCIVGILWLYDLFENIKRNIVTDNTK